jgi:DNA-binding LacI/PurR family transcriptional regulator
MNTRPPSLRAVAAAARVSVATVSRVVNTVATVDPKLRHRVERALRELGYHHNALASAVMREFRAPCGRLHRGTLALLAHHPEKDWHRDELYYYHEFVSGANERAEKLGYKTEVFCLNEPGVSRARLAGILEARGIEGVLLLPLPTRTHSLSFPFEHFASIKLGYMLQSPLLHRVTTDYVMHLSRVLERLDAAGYERVGYVVDDLIEERLARLAQAHFLLYQQKVPRQHRVPLYTGQLLGNEAGAKPFLSWWKKHRPDAIICQHLQPYFWMREEGIRFPSDAGFVAITTRPGHPEVSGMLPCLGEIAATGIDLLSHAVLHADRGVPRFQRTVLICGTWHEGRTLRPTR